MRYTCFVRPTLLMLLLNKFILIKTFKVILAPKIPSDLLFQRNSASRHSSLLHGKVLSGRSDMALIFLIRLKNLN